MQETFSSAELLASLTECDRLEAIASLSEAQAKELVWDWRFWARPKQLAPEGDWSLWIIRAGRGFGKTRSGSGWVHERAMSYPGRWIALVARNPADARDYMIEGPGGLLRNTPPHERPLFEPSKRRLTWPNGSWATIYSDEEPDQLRGFSGDTAWLDEFAKFKKAREGWDNLQFGMRESSTDRPRRLITTTPRPIPLMRELEKKSKTITITGTSHENRANLDPTWYEETILGYEGTRIGRQEVNAEYVDDVPGALWTSEMLESARVDEAPEMARIVVAVDPSGTKGEVDEVANDIGIVVVGIGVDGRGYVLADLSCNLSPEGWARRVVNAYNDYEADRVVAETNYGGAMVESVLRAVDPNIPFSEVKASRGTGGKSKRAEPVAALYERGLVSHVGKLTALEDQMMLMTSAEFMGEGSPDRVDAAVWGLTDIMLNSSAVYPIAIPQFQVQPFQVPTFWPRAFAMKVEPGQTTCLWGAYDKEQDTLYITTEHSLSRGDPASNVAAISARGRWVPGMIESDETNLQARRDMAALYVALGLEVLLADRSFETGVTDMLQRVSTARLKVFATCQGFFRDYRSHRRDEDGKIIGGGLMDCARILCRPPVIQMMRVKPPSTTTAPRHVGDRKMAY